MLDPEVLDLARRVQRVAEQCEPERGPRNAWLFSFQDLIVLRTAQGLSASLVPYRRITKALKELRRNLPEEMPLSGLRIAAVGDTVVVKEGDARWQADHTITLFDNGAVPNIHPYSRAIRERIDFAHRTVSLIGRDVRTPPILSGSQGDNQVLANGNAFVGWGEAPYFTEFNAAGQVVFDAHLPAPAQIYRAFRAEWNA